MPTRASHTLSHFASYRGRNLRVWSLIDLFRQRRTLANLNDHELQDIGVTRKEAQKEATRPLWDVPAHWRK